ncbi:MAG: TlpA family protein disulfide reductase [Candidatus Rokuibacteriota bacterium]
MLVILAAGAVPDAQGVDRFRPWSGPTPALELKDLAGDTHTLARYRGRVVLINFWATWCPPCRDEMPSLQELWRRLAGQPFVLLGVNYGEGPNRISGFLRQVPVDFPILRDPRHEAIEAWRVRTLPATFLIGSDGQVRYSVVGELDWAADDVLARVRGLLP